MEKENNGKLNNIQSQIFEAIGKNDIPKFKQLVISLKSGVNFVDEHGMTPLQHSCCKGNKVAVQILLDMGANINYNQHGANYSPLHFAALSGKTEICRMLLDAGINPNSTNSVSRTASQMAAFVGNHSCVETINNYVPVSELECYSNKSDKLVIPLVPVQLLNSFHEFVVNVNLNPVRVALNLQSLGLLKNLSDLKKALQIMCEKKMTTTNEINEILAFKFHYLSWIVGELVRCEEQCKAQKKEKSDESDVGKHDFVEVFIKRVLKETKQGHLDYIEFIVRDCAREFPFRECTIYRQVISQLAQKDPRPALHILHRSINGHRGFEEEVPCCSTCGAEKPDKKCSKCKLVQYCDRECQRLHWFMHKKNCTRPTATKIPESNLETATEPINTKELQEEILRMGTG